MVNDTNTLNGALMELGSLMAQNLTTQGLIGVSASDGLTTLANDILLIQGGGGTSCPRLVTGSFTTGSTGGDTGTVTLDYDGTGYPIIGAIFVQGGAYNPNTEYYSSLNRYDVGAFYFSKSVMTSTPTYATSSSLTQNQAVTATVYKNGTSTATAYARSGASNSILYNSSSTNASTTYNCVRFKGNNKTMSYYIGNRENNSIGLARDTTFDYIIVYNE